MSARACATAGSVAPSGGSRGGGAFGCCPWCAATPCMAGGAVGRRSYVPRGARAPCASRPIGRTRARGRGRCAAEPATLCRPPRVAATRAPARRARARDFRRRARRLRVADAAGAPPRRKLRRVVRRAARSSAASVAARPPPPAAPRSSASRRRHRRLADRRASATTTPAPRSPRRRRRATAAASRAHLRRPRWPPAAARAPPRPPPLPVAMRVTSELGQRARHRRLSAPSRLHRRPRPQRRWVAAGARRRARRASCARPDALLGAPVCARARRRRRRAPRPMAPTRSRSRRARAQGGTRGRAAAKTSSSRIIATTPRGPRAPWASR